MKRLVGFFDDLGTEPAFVAGGKGGTLAFLYRKGYPVPNGFVISPPAFENDDLAAEAWARVQACLGQMRKSGGPISFSVRSSAVAEDSSVASFAGQFETVLDVSDDEEIRKAIQTVRRSRHSEGVRTYSEARGISASHDMAVVVQQLVRADISGVLFTADPVTGNRERMTGNFIFGLGEALVSGRVAPHAFTLRRPTHMWQRAGYEGAPELERFAGGLVGLGNRLEKDLGGPQDIEWAIAGGQLYLLQSRPITTLVGHNPATGEWNDSVTGNYLWSNVNFGEAVSEVMTPLSWSVLQLVFETWKILPGYTSSGNIGGRPYLNLSVFASAFQSLGKSKRDTLQLLESLLYTRVPDGMEVPTIPLSGRLTASILLSLLRLQMKQATAVRGMRRFIVSNPLWYQKMRERVQRAETGAELISLWNGEIQPHLTRSVWSVMGSVSRFADYATRLRRDLTGLVGPDDADALISNQTSTPDAKGGSELLASLGPVLGIAMVARGELSRGEYLARYGHRGPNEFELSVPRPAEDSSWLDLQLSRFSESPVDVEGLLSRRRGEFDAAWTRFRDSHPEEAGSIRSRLDEAAARGRMREAVRSEYVRDRWVSRNFAVRAGEVTGLGDGVFFLGVEELLRVLSGDESIVKCIPARQETHRRYSALPAYPSIILGRFDPVRWAVDPNRRADVYDATGSDSAPADDAEGPESQRIAGAAGAPGRIEGVVRRLDHPDEGDQLRGGEILVTSQTDIAWTVLFPRAAAVVTDVGAPLSHAAIVARELGIPAVVGCRDATMRLHTGDRVLVDGGRGIVELLAAVPSAPYESRVRSVPT